MFRPVRAILLIANVLAKLSLAEVEERQENLTVDRLHDLLKEQGQSALLFVVPKLGKAHPIMRCSRTTAPYRGGQPSSQRDASFMS